MAGTGGRGARLAQLSSSLAQPGVQSAEPPKPFVPRGRAANLLAISTGSTQGPCLMAAVDLSLRTPESIVNPSAIMPVATVEPPVEEMEELAVETRPVIKRGETGKPIRATANYIRLHMDPNKGFFEYEVRFSPTVDSRNLRFRYLQPHSAVFGGVKTFDGVTLYLPIRLPHKVTVLKSLSEEGEEIEVKIIFKKKKSLQDGLHVYNVLFNKIFHILDFAMFQRKFYNPLSSAQIPEHRLEIWPGYVTAVEEYEDGVMLCCDSSHRVLRTLTVLDICQGLIQKDRGSYKETLKKEVIGQSVLTRYNNKTYRIDDIDFAASPTSTFISERKGVQTEMSYLEYYKNQYNITVRDPGQPLLLSRVKKMLPEASQKIEQLICLLPELCYLTGLTDHMRSDFRLMKEIARHTRITPNQRQYCLKQFVQSVEKNADAKAQLTNWGLTLGKDTVDVNARVVMGEDITFGCASQINAGPSADWNNAIGRQKVLEGVDLMRWAVVYVQRDRETADDFVSWMNRLGPGLGIKVMPPIHKIVPVDKVDVFLRTIRECIDGQTQIVTVIAPTMRDDRYTAIKKLCCAEVPIPSQVVNARTLAKREKNRSIVLKILLQMNCKLGGSLWSLKFPFQDNVMIVGIDSYHDAGMKGASVGGFVASLNRNLTQWYSRVCIQSPGQEMMDNLKVNFNKACRKYYEVNHRYPDRIFIYRDGLGDSQLKTARDYEVAQFRSCFNEFCEGYEPKLIFIVCQKRINTRIFASLGTGEHNQLDNPPPGTVVDNVVTRRSWYDFFLVSQHVRQGTVTPTHYVVVHDDSNIKVDHLQRITYKLCHLYYNWPGTIRVPAPVQYAHKLAQLVGQHVKRQPSESLSDSLYYL